MKYELRDTIVGKIPVDWKLTKIGDVADFRQGLQIAKKLRYDRMTLSRLPLLRITDMITGNFSEYVELGDAPASAIANQEDIVLTRTGQVGLVFTGLRGVVHNNCFRVIFDYSKYDRYYVYYFLKGHVVQGYIESATPGSVQRDLTHRTFKHCPFIIPPLYEQRKIGRILKALDDKIELAHRTNQTLEAIARAIFKSWFVDFDPVWAKMDGEQPYGMDAETAALFPDAFEESKELGLIPEGWKVKSLDQIAHYQNGLALQKYPPESDGYLPVIKIRELRQGSSDDNSGKASPGIRKECIVDDGDVIFSWSGSLLVDIWCGGKGALNQHLFKVTSREYPRWFYYHWTKHHLAEFQRIAADKVTTMGHIKRQHLSEAYVVVPSDGVLQAGNKVIKPLVEAVVCNNLQSRALAKLRDTLLPKLISGQLRVPDIEASDMELSNDRETTNHRIP